MAEMEIDGMAAVAVQGLQDEMDRRFLALQRERDLTSEATRDYINAQIAVVTQRLLDIDRATALLNETINRVPTELQQAITHVNSVIDEKMKSLEAKIVGEQEVQRERFSSIDKQFAERDTRSERESRDNKVAVDAAFAAQKEAAAKQDEGNQKAIDKSERATTETINKLNELVSAANKALSDKIDDLKIRITTVESFALGGRQVTADRHQSISSSTAILMVLIGVMSIITVVAVATHGFTK